MKIAMFSDCYLDLTGGIATVMNAQKKALEERGHIVYIFSTGFPRTKKTLAQLAQKNIFMVPSCKLFFFKLTPVSRRPAVIERWLLKHHPEIREFDIYYTHYESGCSIAGIRLGKKLNIPVVQIMHGREDMGETNIIPFGLRSIVAFFLNLFHSWYLPHTVKVKRDHRLANSFAKAKMWELMVNHANSADAVVTPSKHFANKLKHYGVKKQIHVIPNGVDDTWLAADVTPRIYDKNQTLKIIWHSRISAEKRIMPFLRALSNVPSKYQLDVFGGGGDAFRARRFAKRHHMNVRFHGNTDFKTIYKQLLKSDLDILASYNFDTFGMTLVEAEVAGVPVFICDPDLAEVVPAGGTVLATGPEIAKMTDALTNIVLHPEKIPQMSAVMLRHRHEAVMSHRILKLEKLFKELVS